MRLYERAWKDGKRDVGTRRIIRAIVKGARKSRRENRHRYTGATRQIPERKRDATWSEAFMGMLVIAGFLAWLYFAP